MRIPLAVRLTGLCYTLVIRRRFDFCIIGLPELVCDVFSCVRTQNSGLTVEIFTSSYHHGFVQAILPARFCSV
jgi:hypothetical protein